MSEVESSPQQPNNFVGYLTAKLATTAERCIPSACLTDPESSRRGRLITRFGFIGFLFGILYASCYVVIQFYWGAAIIIVCSLIFGAAPFLMKSTRSMKLAGNLLAATMTAGFTLLCAVEGGLRGHSIAWLVSVPLCAFLLVGQESARFWAIMCLLAGGGVIAVDLAGIQLPIAYDPAWHSLVTAAGYLGLITFMFILGMVFETGRENAFKKMTDALAKLKSSNEQLIYLNKEKNEFLGIAAHDLKNPLTTIIGYAELLEMGSSPDQAPRMAGSIVSAGTRMRDLISNLLDANAIEQGRFASKIECCDIATLVAQSVEHNHLTATKKNIAFAVTTHPGLLAKADQNATVQILDNLISNAIKYSPPGTTVRVTAGSAENRIVIAVKDEGPGIGEADQKMLFQKFTKLTARPTAGESSNGLGLSIVKRLAETMAGSVECESVLGSGATFSVHLPQWPTDSNAAGG